MDHSKIQNKQALTKFQDKFYGKVPISSQLNQRKGLKTIDIFERTRAKSYAMPKNRKWTKREAVPVPLFINLAQVSNNVGAKGKTARAATQGGRDIDDEDPQLRRSIAQASELQIEIQSAQSSDEGLGVKSKKTIEKKQKKAVTY